MNWPIGCGEDFKGVYDREKKEVLAFTQRHAGSRAIHAAELSMDNEAGPPRSCSASGCTARFATMWSFSTARGTNLISIWSAAAS